jgi:hypothetical protein
MLSVKNSPFLLSREHGNNLTKTERKALLKEKSGTRGIPDLSKINDTLETQLYKFIYIADEEINKFRFYSKNLSEFDDTLEIFDNELLYLDIIEQKLLETISDKRKQVADRKAAGEAAIKYKAEKKFRDAKDTFKEYEMLRLVNRLPEDMVRVIATYFRPEIRLILFKEKYPSFYHMSNNKVPTLVIFNIREQMKRLVHKHKFGRFYTGGKRIGAAYNANENICNIYTLFKGNVRNDMMGDIYRALDWVETLANYYNNMAANPYEDPNSSNNKNLAEYYNVLIRMYQTAVYVSRQHR